VKQAGYAVGVTSPAPGLTERNDMPPASVVKKRGKPVRIRTKRLSDGTLLRIYVFDSRGKRGGHTWAEKVKSSRSSARRRQSK
jgi:hypothetical protein